jgi:hypothetical protein
MNKRGFFLAEETMKIILAVICLGFLIFVLGKMYYSYSIGKEEQQAKDTLARIETEINSMKEDGQREIMIYNPDSWFLVGFSGQEMPNFCIEKKWNTCLCACSKTIKPWVIGIKDKCDNEGTCVYFPGKQLTISQIDLENLPISLSIRQTGNQVVFSLLDSK